ncbi:hypothetical protein D9Q98_000265 [Chlorella vulgaris]|uniref:Uncharacterized protein n=1 Tax=Chlorella vulgaris TaxID=3077 RepID=A0A9D4TXW2_CHLVU|nr:hypothetical protein D9Q98_000265 [Chlorella vulgaris]
MLHLHSLRCLALAIAVVSASAAPLYQRPVNADCVQLDGGSTDVVQLYPDQWRLGGDEDVTNSFETQVTTALGFTVTYFPAYKVVNNTIAGEVYVLYQCGADAPPAASFPEGTKFFNIPLTSVSAPETVPYAFLENLGVTDRVHDVSEYVASPCGQALLACPTGSRASPGFDELSNVTALEEGVGGSIDGMLSTSASEYPKSFALSAALDPGALNRAEWIKFVGLFFNLEKEATDVFDAIKAEYDATKAAAATKEADKPVVAWAQYFSFPGLGESYQLSFDPYQTQLTEDAGGAVLDRAALAAVKGVQSTEDSPTLSYSWGEPGAFATQDEAKAAFLEALSQADAIIDETYAFDPTAYTPDTFLSTYNLTAADLAAVPAYAGKQVFREDGLLSFNAETGEYGMDWFEGAIARPGQVLKDLVRAAQPELAAKDQGFTWIRNLFTEQPAVVGASNCAAKSACSAEPATICPFVTMCAAGQAPAILESNADGTCTYAECGQASALQPAQAAQAPAPATNAAAMAGPAIVLTVLIVAFVEVLMHFC